MFGLKFEGTRNLTKEAKTDMTKMNTEIGFQFLFIYHQRSI